MKVNRQLLPIKAHYFLRYAGTSTLVMLLPPLMREKGLSAQVVGVLWTILRIVGLITNTISGTLADKLRAHRFVALSSIIVLTVGCVSMVWIPKLLGAEDAGMASVWSTTFVHNSSLTQANLTDILTTHTLPQIALMDPEMVMGEGQPTIINTEEVPEFSDNPIMSLMMYPQFWMVFFALMLEQIGISTCVMISDAVCFQILGSERHKYGQQRMWGTIGMGVSGVVSGALIDIFSVDQTEKNYLPAVIICLFLTICNLVVVARMRIPYTHEHKMNTVNVGSVLLHPRVVLFLVTVYVMGLTLGTVWVFKLMLVEDVALSWDPEFPTLKLLQGLVLGIETFGGELPFFFLSGMIIQHVGHTTVLVTSLVSLSLRCCLYFAVSNPWYFLPIELLNGLNFGLFHAAMASYASLIAPPGSQATLQSIVNASFYSGLSTAGFLGGSLYQMMGGSLTFLAVGVFLCGYSIIFILLHLLITKYCGHRKDKGYEVPASASKSCGNTTDVDPESVEPTEEPLVEAV